MGTSRCTLILQGRVSVQVGQDGFLSQAGAFRVLAKDALMQDLYRADFSASVNTEHVRCLSISRESFRKAKILSQDELALTDALGSVRRLPSAWSVGDAGRRGI